jgi:hypothetical protein
MSQELSSTGIIIITITTMALQWSHITRGDEQ